MKSGCNESGIRRGIPTYDAEVWDCTVLHAHGGFVIGSDAHVPEKVGEFAAQLKRALAAGLDPERIVNIERK